MSGSDPTAALAPAAAAGPIQLVPGPQQHPLFQRLFCGILAAIARGELGHLRASSRVTDQFVITICSRILQDFEEGLVADMVSGIGGADRRLATAAMG